MHVNYGRALDTLFPGPNRDKRIARKFGVSVRMAKYLRTGNHWTVRRLAQAADLFGDAWDAALSKPETNWRHNLEMQEIEARLARLEKQLVEMASRSDAGLASKSSASANSCGGGYEEIDFRASGNGRSGSA